MTHAHSRWLSVVYTTVAIAALGGVCATCQTLPLTGTVIYVDRQINPSSCTTYNPATRSCSGGTATAYKTLAGAAGVATAGVSVEIRAGSYSQALVPANSGTASQPLIFQAYGGEVVTITGTSLSPAIDISNRDYITIQGLTIANVQRWLLAVNSHHNTIVGNTFEHATDSGGSAHTGVFFESSTYNQVLNNVIDDSTADNLSLVESDYNLVEGNAITSAAHTLWTIKCGNYNILRGNYFYNLYQKIGEIYDCDGVGVNHDIFIYNGTKHNVVEGNSFAYCPSSGDSAPYDGIQFSGQNTIIRRNAFYNTVGPGLEFTVYSGEAEYTLDNRIYSNILYKTSFAGVSIAPAGYNLAGNLFKNNIFTKSVFVRNDLRWDWYIELDGKPVNIMIGRLDGFVFDHNDIFDVQPGETYTITYGQRDNNNPPQHTVAWWQSNYGNLFTGNLEADPKFVNETGYDFHLQADSPMIDAGVFLTHAIGTSSGTNLPVQDASYFCDGYGIAGEAGDVIRLQGTPQTAHVVGINYSTNTLTLDHSLSWTSGQGVALDYAGSAPDLGEFEYDSGSSSAGDLDCDGTVDLTDINPFVQYMTNFAAWQAAHPGCNPANGDINGDGAYPDFGDLNPFVQLLSGM